MKRIYRRCCGIDVHQATLTACVRVHGPDGKLSQEIRSFGTTSDELLSLHDWLSTHRVSHVAMEATGVCCSKAFLDEDNFKQSSTMSALVNQAICWSRVQQSKRALEASGRLLRPNGVSCIYV